MNKDYKVMIVYLGTAYYGFNLFSVGIFVL